MGRPKVRVAFSFFLDDLYFLLFHLFYFQGTHGTTIFDPVPSRTVSLYNGTLGTDGTFGI
jgi:hypothetical protein